MAVSITLSLNIACNPWTPRRHLPALWFAGLANQLFWWTYAKAMWRSFTAACCCSNISFKATAKVDSLAAQTPACSEILVNPA